MTTETITPVPAMTDVIRMVELPVASIEVRQEDDAEDGRTLVGYAAVFNQWTEINSMVEGHFLERIAPGAFQNTLAKRGDRVKTLFNHGFDPHIGDKPLGKPRRMVEDQNGLWTETPLARTSYNDDLLELLRDGSLDGMSFRFQVTEEEWNKNPERSEQNPDGLKERTLTSLNLREFGPVTWPAYEATSAGVRSADVFRVWQQNPQGFLLPRDDGPPATAVGEQDDDSRAEEPPVGTEPPDRRTTARPYLARLKELTLNDA